MMFWVEADRAMAWRNNYAVVVAVTAPAKVESIARKLVDEGMTQGQEVS